MNRDSKLDCTPTQRETAMIPLASIQKEWIFVSVAMIPLALIGIGAKEQTA
jgi:hypothetical protein